MTREITKHQERYTKINGKYHLMTSWDSLIVSVEELNEVKDKLIKEEDFEKIGDDIIVEVYEEYIHSMRGCKIWGYKVLAAS